MSTAGIDTSSFEERIRGREVNSDQTVTKYTRWVQRFEAWAPSSYDENTLRDFDSFLQDEERIDYPWENNRGKPAPASYSYSSRVGALSAAKLWLKHEHDVSVDTEVQNIASGEPGEFEPSILDRFEVSAVRNDAAFCENDGCHAAVHLGYDAIMRGAELADVRRDDIDWDEQAIYVRAKKGSEPQTVSLSDETWRALTQFANQHPDRDYLFRNSYGRAWTPAAWNQHFRRKHHEAGFHAFARHTRISQMLKGGHDFGEVYLRARHQSPATTLQYISFVPNMEKSDIGWLD